MSPLIIGAAIEVGKALAKTICKMWFKDSDLSTNISSNLVDLIASKTSDTFAQRKGVRQFDTIADDISKDILQIFRMEGSILDEGECKAVADAVAATFNNAKLSNDILFAINVQPTQLYNFITAHTPNPTDGFSEVGTSLYQRILTKSCKYIVEIASELPTFTGETIAEMLERQDLIVNKAELILSEVRRMREGLDLSTEAGRFEEEYREDVARNLDVVQLIGADVSLASRRHRLSVAYITLSVSGNIAHSIAVASGKEHKAYFIGESISVDRTLSSSRRLLITGLAGSGKTTLLQWIAVQAARRSFGGSLSVWNTFLPFYIRLRQYSQKSLPTPEQFPEFAAPFSIDKKPKHWVDTVLHTGEALVLIDGLDELAKAQRGETYTWLKSLIAHYPKCTFIVTSRPHGIEDGWMHDEAFDRALLQDMSPSDINLFIDHWHKAVEQEIVKEEEISELADHAASLKIAIKKTSALRILATNPLLCAMLCALNRERRRQLPVSRVELYEACCQLLLERRDKESRIDPSDYPPLIYSQKKRLLANLAYYMMQINLSEIEKYQLNGNFRQQLAIMPNLPIQTTVENVRDFFVERAGLLREPRQGYFDFAHHTFQEFLAADAILADANIDMLIKNAHLSEWQEVIILAAGLATKKQAETLIQGLIVRGDAEDRYRHQLHLLAISCLETAIELSREMQSALDQRLKQLVPPKDITEVKALALAGEPALKYLGKEKIAQIGKISVEYEVACIYAIARIGGNAALDVLIEYADNPSQEVLNELVKSWEMFEKKVPYAQLVLSKAFEKMHKFSSNNLSSIEGIQYIAGLTMIDLNGCRELSDVTLLSDMASLTDLNLSGCSGLTTLHLANLTSLTNLNLSGCSGLTTVHLANLTSLTNLNLSALDTLVTLQLNELPQLNELNASGCNELMNVQLSGLPNLTRLDLRYCRGLTILLCSGLPNLIDLNLSGCRKLKDVSSLSGLTHLTRLDLRYCVGVTDLSPLAALTELRTFHRP